MMEAQALTLRLPAAEDANAIQLGLMRIQKAVIDDTISVKKAGLLLYSMQLAITNVGRTMFGQAKDDELVMETVDEAEALSNQRSGFSQNQAPFTTEVTEDTEEIGTSDHRDIGSSENQNLPQNNVDKRGLERDQGTRIIIKPILTKDLNLPTLGQTHTASLRDECLPKRPAIRKRIARR
jgi:hypothetical protein